MTAMFSNLTQLNWLTGLKHTVMEIGITGAIDIFIMSIVIYTGLIWLRQSQSAKVAQGILTTGFFYVAAKLFDLALTAAILEGFFAVAVIAVVVIFRDEIRRLFERLARFRPVNKYSVKIGNAALSPAVETLVRTFADLSKERIGALVVIPCKESLLSHLKGGIPLNGELSEPLLKSLFDPHSLGHDGAVVIEGRQVTRFACHLPLSSDFEKLGNKGTRHSAALGLCERTDALCIVVSEENGLITIAREGMLQTLKGPEELLSILKSYFEEVPRVSQTFKDIVSKNYRTKAIAIVISALLWLVLVHGGKQVIRKVSVPVGVIDIPTGSEVVEIKPRNITLTFFGPRRSYFFYTDNSTKIEISLSDKKPSGSIRKIHISDISYPRELTIREIRPQEVEVLLKPKKRLNRSGAERLH